MRELEGAVEKLRQDLIDAESSHEKKLTDERIVSQQEKDRLSQLHIVSRLRELRVH